MTNRVLAVEFDERKVDEIFAEFDQCQRPGASVGVSICGNPVYRKGFGLASMELPVVLSPTIRMRIYSTTKHFTCLAYMLLCEEGKAGIDDPIGKFLPELNPVAHRVTARQLMGNVSGLRDAHDINWQFGGMRQPVSSADLLSFYRDIDDVNFPPDTTWCYCNGGFLLLTVAIERITGQSLEDVFRDRIFKPAGMNDTLLRRVNTDFVQNSATDHVMNVAGGFEKSNLGTAFAGEGGIVSTVDDMLRWLAHMNAPWIGRAATWAAMKAPQSLLNGMSTGYGLGLFTGQYRGVATIYHGGGALGANSQMLKVPDARLDIAVMVNRDDAVATLLANRILDICLPGLDSLKQPSAGPFATGTFYSPITGRVIQLFPRDGQQIASIVGVDYPMQPDENAVLWPSGMRTSLKQSLKLVGDPIRPASIRFSDFGNLDELTAVKASHKNNASAIEGRYRSDTTGTQAIISETDDGAKMHTIGRFGSAEFKLNCLADAIWRAKSPTSPMQGDGILVVDDDGAMLHFSTCCTAALPFRRCG